jgi:hypothetical protein
MYYNHYCLLPQVPLHLHRRQLQALVHHVQRQLRQQLLQLLCHPINSPMIMIMIMIMLTIIMAIVMVAATLTMMQHVVVRAVRVVVSSS